MKDLSRLADEIPVTLLVALAYVSLAFLTDPFSPTAPALAAHGWLTPMAVADGQPWRLLTHAFLHGGILHLLFNLYTLIWLGPPLERSFGSVRFAAIYVVAALGGGVATCLVYGPLQPVVGGSGALFGMFGALVARNMRSGRHAFACFDYQGPRQLLSLIATNLVLGLLVPVISNTAHVGGLLAGFLFVFVFLDPGRSKQAMRPWQIATGAMFAGLLAYACLPVTRWDWLDRAASATTDPARQRQCRLAAAMALLHTGEVDDATVEEVRQEIAEARAEHERMLRGR